MLVKSDSGGACQVMCQVICQVLGILSRVYSLLWFKVRVGIQLVSLPRCPCVLRDPPFAHLFTTPTTDLLSHFAPALSTFSVRMQLSCATLTPGSRCSLDILFFLPFVLARQKLFHFSRIHGWAPEAALLCSQLVN